MYKLRNYLLCALTAILLFFAAAGAEGSFILKNHVLNAETFKYVLKLNNSYEKAYSEMEKQFKSEENATGIPATVYTDAVTHEVFESMVNAQIDAAFDCINGNTGHVDRSVVEAKLDVLDKSVNAFFEDYAKSINYKKDDVYYQKVESVINSGSEVVLDTSDVFQFQKIEKAGYITIAAKLARYSDKIFIASFAVTGFLILILVIANIKGFSGFFYWLGISLGSVSFIAIAGCIWLKQSEYFNRFAIKAQHIYSSITGACYYFTDLLLMINVIVFAAALISLIIFSVAGRKKVSVQ